MDEFKTLSEEQLKEIVGGMTDDEIKLDVHTCPFCGSTNTSGGIMITNSYYGKVVWMHCYGCNCTYEVQVSTNKKTGRGYSFTDNKWMFKEWCEHQVESQQN